MEVPLVSKILLVHKIIYTKERMNASMPATPPVSNMVSAKPAAKGTSFGKTRSTGSTFRKVGNPIRAFMK